MNFNQPIVAGTLSQSARVARQILGNFCIENQQYSVIYLGKIAEQKHEGGSSSEGQPRADESVLLFFELNGHRCAIIDQMVEPCAKVSLSSFLSGRELQIAVLVAQGYANKQIAKHLSISEWTVSTYLRRLFAKLQVDSRAAMVYRCADLIQQFRGPNTASPVMNHPNRFPDDVA
jgi:DNA-binding CsgD family transcriptional regulator